MTDTKLDPERVRVRIPDVVKVIGATTAIVILYMRFEQRMGRIEDRMDAESISRKEERKDLIDSVNGVKNEISKIVVDSVNTRQAQSWIELFRALNKEPFLQLHISVPDLPR